MICISNGLFSIQVAPILAIGQEFYKPVFVMNWIVLLSRIEIFFKNTKLFVSYYGNLRLVLPPTPTSYALHSMIRTHAKSDNANMNGLHTAYCRYSKAVLLYLGN